MKTEIQIPLVPHKLSVLIGGKEISIPVQDIPEIELKEVGDKWTRQLIQKHKQQPNNNFNLK